MRVLLFIFCRRDHGLSLLFWRCEVSKAAESRYREFGSSREVEKVICELGVTYETGAGVVSVRHHTKPTGMKAGHLTRQARFEATSNEQNPKPLPYDDFEEASLLYASSERAESALIEKVREEGRRGRHYVQNGPLERVEIIWAQSWRKFGARFTQNVRFSASMLMQ